MFHFEALKEIKRNIIVDTDIGPDVDDEYATKYEVDQDGTHYAMEMVCEPEEIIASFETMVCK